MTLASVALLDSLVTDVGSGGTREMNDRKILRGTENRLGKLTTNDRIWTRGLSLFSSLLSTEPEKEDSQKNDNASAGTNGSCDDSNGPTRETSA